MTLLYRQTRLYIYMNGSLMIIIVLNNNDMGIFLYFIFITERTDSKAKKYCYWIISDTDSWAFQKQTACTPASKNAEEQTAAIAYCIAKDMQSFWMVERPGFLRIMKVAVPH